MSKQQVHAVGVKIARQYMTNLKGDEKAARYIKSRGLNLAWCIENGLGYSKDSWSDLTSSLSKDEKVIASQAGFIGHTNKNGRDHFFDLYHDRLTFPILDSEGFMVGFGGRYIGSEEDAAKYINTKETEFFNKSSILYNLNRVSKLPVKSIVVVEGYMDVIAARSAGLDNFTAVMGTAFTSEHASEVIKKGINEVTFCFDGDAAGIGAAFKTLPAVSTLRDSRIAVNYTFLPEGRDPDSIIQCEGVSALRDHLNTRVDPEKFIAQHAIDKCERGSASIDKTISAMVEMVNTTQSNDLNTSLAWSHILSSSASMNLTAAKAVIQRVFPEVEMRQRTANSYEITESWHNSNQPT